MQDRIHQRTRAENSAQDSKPTRKASDPPVVDPGPRLRCIWRGSDGFLVIHPRTLRTQDEQIAAIILYLLGLERGDSKINAVLYKASAYLDSGLYRPVECPGCKYVAKMVQQKCDCRVLDDFSLQNWLAERGDTLTRLAWHELVPSLRRFLLPSVSFGGSFPLLSSSEGKRSAEANEEIRARTLSPGWEKNRLRLQEPHLLLIELTVPHPGETLVEGVKVLRSGLDQLLRRNLHYQYWVTKVEWGGALFIIPTLPSDREWKARLLYGGPVPPFEWWQEQWRNATGSRTASVSITEQFAVFPATRTLVNKFAEAVRRETLIGRAILENDITDLHLYSLHGALHGMKPMEIANTWSEDTDRDDTDADRLIIEPSPDVGCDCPRCRKGTLTLGSAVRQEKLLARIRQQSDFTIVPRAPAVFSSVEEDAMQLELLTEILHQITEVRAVQAEQIAAQKQLIGMVNELLRRRGKMSRDEFWSQADDIRDKVQKLRIQ